MIGTRTLNGVVLCIALVGAIAIGIWPLATTAVVGAIVIFRSFLCAWVRLVWFALGALLVFQTTDGLSVTKLAYLAGVLVAVSISVVRLQAIMREPWARRFNPALIGAGGLGVWLLVVSPVYSIMVVGVEPQSWARDAITNLLIVAAIPLGIEAAASVQPHLARLITVVVGGLGAVGFAVAWIQRRGFGTVDPLQADAQPLLASLTMLAVPLALALVMALVGRGIRWIWLIYGACLVLSVLVTGTRTGLLFPIAVLGIIGSVTKQRVPVLKAAAGLALGCGLVAVGLPIVGDRLTTVGFGQDRIQAALDAVLGGLSTDQSGALRERAYAIAEGIAIDHPLLGQGVGGTFANPSSGVLGGFSLDTPWLYPAKFGLIGTLVLGSALCLVVYSCARRADGPWLRELTATRAIAVTWIVLLPFGPITEDKGFAVSLALLVMFVGSAARTAPGSARKTVPEDVVKTAAGGGISIQGESTERQILAMDFGPSSSALPTPSWPMDQPSHQGASTLGARHRTWPSNDK